MKALSRFFSFLTYGALIYAGFTAVIAGISLIPAKNYAFYGWSILILTIAGFLALIILNIFKCKWSSFFVIAGTMIARVYISFLMVNRSAGLLEMKVFYKHHLPALLVVLFALLSTLFYKKYLKDERGVTFQKTEKDREHMEEKKSIEEMEGQDAAIL